MKSRFADNSRAVPTTFSRENISFPLICMSGYFMDNHAFRLLDVLVHLYIYDISTSYFKDIELA